MENAVAYQGVLDPKLVADVFQDFWKLNACSETEKLQCRRQDFQSGYTPAGVEGVRDLPKDFYRSFWDLHGPGRNTFPPGFDGSRIERLFSAVESFTVSTFQSQYPEIAGMVEGAPHGLRVTFFQREQRGRIAMASHQDISLLTAFIGGSGPGLQTGNDECWEDVENPIGSAVIAIGTALRLFRPDLRPFQHRVMSFGTERISLALFLELRRDVVLPNGETAEARLRRIVSRIRGSDPY